MPSTWRRRYLLALALWLEGRLCESAQSPLHYVFDGLGISTLHKGGITGKTSVVAITDTGIYLPHAEFVQSTDVFNRINNLAPKVIFYETFADDKDESSSPDGTCGHGTHVSALLAGRTIGAAPDAKIAFQDIAYRSNCTNCSSTSSSSVVVLKTPSTVAEIFDNQTKAGAKIFSFSWGADSRGNDLLLNPQDDYNPLARQIDEYLYDHPDVLLVAAAGNNGQDGPKSLLSPGGAKNVLTIGASFVDYQTFPRDVGPLDCGHVINMDAVTFFSSRGPTKDGRLKPDIVAPGVALTSAKSLPYNSINATDTCQLSGTSQATPVAAAMALLVREWLEQGAWLNGTALKAYALSFIPSSLLKAILIHSAQPMQRRLPAFDNTTSCATLEDKRYQLKSYPDYSQGYGRPNLTALWFGSVASFLPNHTGLMPSLTNRSVHEYKITVKRPERLRIVIAWTDAPIPTGTVDILTNDLDLRLDLAGDVVLFPLSGGAQRDSINNVEMIDIPYSDLEAAVPRSLSVDGKITLVAKVIGANVQRGPQRYSIVSSVPLRANTDDEEPESTTHGLSVWIGLCSVLALLLITFVLLLRWRGRHKTNDESLHTAFRGLLRYKEKCKQCGFESADAVALEEHIEDVHKHVDKCPHCHFTSANLTLLASHVHTFHGA
ncbi:hypothetical protein LEN26_002963 [Aphanomyces euteiches]|nr:hypothetical protein AeMF1_006674 [Aphanomyces euteiches]KAH9158460.1 hypothetical protein LEN26_002963 [Aphanomyces euteiches]